MPIKICKRCKIEQSIEEFYLISKKGSSRVPYCRTCLKNRKRKPENPLTIKARHRKNRQEVISHYGGKCACCGESVFEFLSIDHINGDGRKHREQIKTQDICDWLRKNKYPEGFRVLCFNCNCAIGFHGYCPHEYKKDDPYEI